MEIIQHRYDRNGERVYQTPSRSEAPVVDLSTCERIPYRIFDAYFAAKKSPEEEVRVPFNLQKARDYKLVLALRLGTTNWFNIRSVDSIVDFLSETETMGNIEFLKERDINLYISGGVSMEAIGVPKK